MIRLLLASAVLAAGGGFSFYWLTHRPTAQRRPPQSQATLVETLEVIPGTHRVVVRAMGTVIPARVVELSSRVSGEIVTLSPEFVTGGRFRANEEVVKIDPEDCRLAVEQQETEVRRLTAVLEQGKSEVTQRESDVARAESELKIERGQQSVAEREYELLRTAVSPEDLELVLRQPQLKTAQANCEAAQAAKAAAEAACKAAEASRGAASVALRKAELDMARTTIRAPFNAAVRSKSVDMGSQVSLGTPLAELVGTDEYWIEAAVPVDELKWINIPEENGRRGATVRVYHETAWGRRAFRVGTVARLMTDLEPQGRMARIVVAVQDPLGLAASPSERRPLNLGAYVRVEIEGRDLPNVVQVPRTALRDGNRVWVMQPDHTLDVREVNIAWSGDDDVLVSDGLGKGDLLVISDLGAPVQGMVLRTAASSPAASPSGSASGASDRREDRS